MQGFWGQIVGAMPRIVRAVALGLTATLLLGSGTLWLAEQAGSGLAARTIGRVDGLFRIGAIGPAAGTSSLGIPGRPFHLVDEHGSAVTDADYRGRWMLVYFGYTFCPDACPTELQTIATALRKLGPDAAKVAPLFITVDPERDTPAVLAKYVKLFDARIVGLTGTGAEIAEAARAFRVYYAKATVQDGATYFVDHSSFVYLMDPKGRLAALFSQDTSADDMAVGIRERLVRQS